MLARVKEFFGIRTDHVVVRSTEVGNGVILMAMRGGSEDGRRVLERAAEAGALITVCDDDGKFIGYVPRSGMGSLGRGQNERVNRRTLKLVGDINSGINLDNYETKINEAIDRKVDDDMIRTVSDFSNILKGSVDGQTYEERVEEIMRECQEP